jgi:hypothetical protein
MFAAKSLTMSAERKGLTADPTLVLAVTSCVSNNMWRFPSVRAVAAAPYLFKIVCIRRLARANAASQGSVGRAPHDSRIRGSTA